jgi:cell fate regulator YaaT (PSP1 superfamily)
MFLVAVETCKDRRIAYLLNKETNLKIGELCSFKIKDRVEIGRIKHIFLVDKGNISIHSQYIKRIGLEEEKDFKRRSEIEERAYEVGLTKIALHKLPMKLVAVKCPWESNRLIFYYTAKERIDFRALVKDLAAIFKMCIQMQQIGVRDKSQILGGCGICGRPICCSSFLRSKMKKKLNSVSLKTARLQNLPLTSSKISGLCGRLRCCLNFESPIYDRLKKELPSMGEVIEWQGEKTKVVGQNVLKGTVTVETKEGIKRILTKAKINPQK